MEQQQRPPPSSGEVSTPTQQEGEAQSAQQQLPIEPVPTEREKNLQRREGFEYFMLTLSLTPGVKLGLGIKDFRNMIIVCKVDEGFLSQISGLRVKDHIVDVNGTPVSNREVCRELIIKGFKGAERKSTLIIERAASQEADAMMQGALEASAMEAPSQAVSQDVKEIMKKYMGALKQGHGKGQQQEGILRTADPNRKVTIVNEKPVSTHIRHDIADPAKLRKVPQKTPPPMTPAPASQSNSQGQVRTEQ
ncbi:hypothetical protein WR25_10148 [Diploscapter pachys]|uniref:PDZ domain-containing protein n=1 Tax=Diploscapter pachys TaxID=2018661 RepID=A0A2A2LVG1_9BILA|nr:hypothetical protein WR25_10148 [Diploscapter pachys]